jgi:hypothetical protein
MEPKMNYFTNNIEDRRFFSAEEKDAVWHEQGGKCAICGDAMPVPSQCAGDHIISYKDGGPTSVDNLQVVHAICNLKKGSKSGTLVRGFQPTGKPLQFNMEAYREDQKTAHVGIINAIANGATEIGLLAYPRFGKTELFLNVAVDAIERGNISLAICINTRVNLRDQCVEPSKLIQMCGRYDYQNTSRPISSETFCVTDNNFITTAWRNENEYVLSATAQSLIQGRGMRGWKKLVKQASKKAPVLIILDECQDFAQGEGRAFFSAINELASQYNVVVLSMTGTAERADGLIPPGFRAVARGETEMSNHTVLKRKLNETDDGYDPERRLAEFANVESTTTPITVEPIHPELNFPLSRGFAQNTVCHINPNPLDTHVGIFDEGREIFTGRLSEASPSQITKHRLKSRFVTDPTVVRDAAIRIVDGLQHYKVGNFKPKAMVFTLDDTGEREENAHARQVEAAIHAQAKSRGLPIKTQIITQRAAGDANTEQSDMLRAFKNNDVDVAILKKAGAVGFDCSPVKVVADLGSVRSPTASIQLWLRGATPHATNVGIIEQMTLILPADQQATALYAQYIGGAGGCINSVHREETGTYIKELQESEPETPTVTFGTVVSTPARDTLGYNVTYTDHAVVTVFERYEPDLAAVHVNDTIAQRAARYRPLLSDDMLDALDERLTPTQPPTSYFQSSESEPEDERENLRKSLNKRRWGVVVAYAVHLRGDEYLRPFLGVRYDHLTDEPKEYIRDYQAAFVNQLVAMFGTSQPSKINGLAELREMSAFFQAITNGDVATANQMIISAKLREAQNA